MSSKLDKSYAWFSEKAQARAVVVSLCIFALSCLLLVHNIELNEAEVDSLARIEEKVDLEQHIIRRNMQQWQITQQKKQPAKSNEVRIKELLNKWQKIHGCTITPDPKTALQNAKSIEDDMKKARESLRISAGKKTPKVPATIQN